MRVMNPPSQLSYHALPRSTSFQPFWWVVTRLVSQQPGLWLSRCSMGFGRVGQYCFQVDLLLDSHLGLVLASGHDERISTLHPQDVQSYFYAERYKSAALIFSVGWICLVRLWTTFFPAFLDLIPCEKRLAKPSDCEYTSQQRPPGEAISDKVKSPP